MKKLMMILMVLLVSAGSANGHMAGLPIADGAVPLNQGAKRISGGFVLGDDVDLFGGRFAYGMDNRFTLFGDFGFTDPDPGDTGWGIQGGGLYALPITDIPFNMAARGTLGYTRFDLKYAGPHWNPVTERWRTRSVSVDIITMNIGAVASKDIDMFTFYGYLGINYTRVSNGGSDSEMDPAIGGGVLFKLNRQFSLYAELMHIDDPWLGLGFRYAF
ncbi:MAG: hypothetical protein C4548_05220 [Desulfobacteraceae bacterium]|jgi:hypothetical protein|nr:MAG: hypothetical protein C4548_05220 [Desulfobacteraceae bacterium]